MKKQVLITVSYIAEIDENLLTGKMDDIRREKFNKPLSKRFPRTMRISDEVRAIWERTSIIFLDTKYHNYTKCSVCDSLITDKQKPDYIAGLSVGEYVEEKIYCPECAVVMRDKNFSPSQN